MKKTTTLTLLSAILSLFSIQTAFAGPFGIDKGMSLAEVTRVCKTTPKSLGDNVYEITPPKTNDMFKSYLVRIDSDHGVYWLKAIGKDIYTNGYGSDLKSRFNRLVESIEKAYGEESYRGDSLQKGSILSDPQYFMHTLIRGDRTLNAVWSKQFDAMNAMKEVLSDTVVLKKLASTTEHSDTTELRNFVLDKMSKYEKLPSDINIIMVYCKATSPSLGYVALEYSFSNDALVEAKANSVF